MEDKDDFYEQEPRSEPSRHLQDELPEQQGQLFQNNFISQEDPELIHQSDSNEQKNQKQIIRNQSNEPQSDEIPVAITQQPQYFPISKQESPPMPQGASQSQIQWIYKQASMQRIGGTFDFFAGQMDKYRRHIESRKNVLQNIYCSIEKSRSNKSNTVGVLKQYFKQYSQICTTFHSKCYKYEIPSREQNESKLVNIRMEMKSGLQRLFNVRKNVGNEHSQLEKYIKNNTISKIEKAVEIYWGNIENSEGRAKGKRDNFIQKYIKFQKRIDKIAKVYNKGRYGSEVEEDLFIEMTKFVKEQRQMRYAIFEWGKEVISLRKTIIKGDYTLMIEFESILAGYKSFNDSIFQLKKKKINYPEKLKEQIQKKYLYQNLCLPIDNDYIIGVLNIKKRKSLTMLTQTNYQQFLNEQYFGSIIGDTYQLLKGTVVKSFPLKNPDEDLVRTISGNFVLYSRKTLQIINKLTLVNTVAEFEGNGCVRLREKVIGLIFDSEKSQRLVFANNDRAEELVMSFNSEFGKQ